MQLAYNMQATSRWCMPTSSIYSIITSLSNRVSCSRGTRRTCEKRRKMTAVTRLITKKEPVYVVPCVLYCMYVVMGFEHGVLSGGFGGRWQLRREGRGRGEEGKREVP